MQEIKCMETNEALQQKGIWEAGSEFANC
uniref:Uncharacterized protein n=1 Tax=Anguilla anguilla TaxID=7936 RepID=A0A0E9PKQ0_ANGAN